MSLELDWSLLDEELSSRILQRLNASIANTKRPDFLGEINLTSLEFGSDSPDVRLTGVGDVWRQFLDSRNEELHSKGEGSSKRQQNKKQKKKKQDDRDASYDYDDVDDFVDDGVLIPGEIHRSHGNHLEQFAEQALPFTGQISGIGGPRLQTFRQYTPSDIQQIHGSGGSIVGTPLGHPAAGSGSVSASGLSTPAWGAGLGTRSSFHHSNAPGTNSASGYFSPWQPQHQPNPGAGSRSNSFLAPPPASHLRGRAKGLGRSSSFAPTTHGDFTHSRDGRSPSAAGSHPDTNSKTLPSLQLHLSVIWSTNTFKLGIDTSLLINHPTPSFMELPLHVSVIGLGVQAGCVVAFQDDDDDDDDDDDGEAGKGGRKIHISLVEDERQVEDDDEEAEEEDEEQKAGDEKADKELTSDEAENGLKPTTSTTVRRSPLPPQRQLTIGERLIPHITLETSVGNADKHVLRNVGKVEKFLVELIRKAIQDELVWPNFYTVALPR
ncbi:unnamed protein product [Sympodiomycopsis kandeliae]